jgi:hypothetical protein
MEFFKLYPFIGGFILTQSVAILVFIIKFFVDHVRLKDRVSVVENSCSQCKQEYDDDIAEIKQDVKEMKVNMTTIQLSIARVETLLSGKTVQL